MKDSPIEFGCDLKTIEKEDPEGLYGSYELDNILYVCKVMWASKKPRVFYAVKKERLKRKYIINEDLYRHLRYEMVLKPAEYWDYIWLYSPEILGNKNKYQIHLRREDICSREIKLFDQGDTPFKYEIWVTKYGTVINEDMPRG